MNMESLLDIASRPMAHAPFSHLILARRDIDPLRHRGISEQIWNVFARYP